MEKLQGAERGSERLESSASGEWRSRATPCQEFGLLSHGIFQDDFRCLIGSLVAVKLHRNAPHCVLL